jgi:RimJ/RimL family protein N-acetyltransferase
MDDLPLYARMLSDPEMMAELGGPVPDEGMEAKLREIVRGVEDGSVWYSVIVPDEDSSAAAGSVCIWTSEADGEPQSEIGWMVLPEYQGRGLATEATRAMLERARDEGKWGAIHAHPGVTNGPSNAICRKLRFRKVGEREVEFRGRPLRTNHWVLDPRDAS